MRAARAAPAGPVVPVLTVPRLSALWGRLGLPAAMGVRVVRVVPPGLAGFVVMVARAVPVVLVAGVVTPVRTRVRRDLRAGPAVPAVMRALVERQVPVRAPPARPATPVPVVRAAPAARVVPVLTAPRASGRSGPRGTPAAMVVPVVRAVPPGPAGCVVMAAWAVPVVSVAGVVRAYTPERRASPVAPVVSVVMRVRVARPVAVRAPAVRPGVQVSVARVAPAGRAVPVLTAPRASGRSGPRGTPAAMVVPVVRAVPPGLVGCVVMVAWAVLAVWVGVVVMGR